MPLACSYIEEHYQDRISVDDIARAVSLSTGHLIRLFKQQLDTTPHSYLMHYRISRAKELLRTTSLTSASIAACVGFSSESHFSYRFKKVVGLSPRAYRTA